MPGCGSGDSKWIKKTVRPIEAAPQTQRNQINDEIEFFSWHYCFGIRTSTHSEPAKMATVSTVTNAHGIPNECDTFAGTSWELGFQKTGQRPTDLFTVRVRAVALGVRE